jgi:uncharacterized membrane protein YcaP (DUF421 family)
MKPEEIRLSDWSRILVGDVPPAFLLEILLRMAFVYLVLVTSMRLLGKRMSAQSSRNELAAMVSLAAAIGVPILSPDRGLLPAVVIAAVVVSIAKLTAYLAAKNQKIESITQGSITTLVEDSVMNIEAMTKTRLSRERVMSELRAEKVKHMGEVKRLYMEANGSFTLIKDKNPKPGLPVIPESDTDFIRELKVEREIVCHTCGNPNKRGDTSCSCENCESKQWVRAMCA